MLKYSDFQNMKDNLLFLQSLIFHFNGVIIDNSQIYLLPCGNN